jgi:hypothetical protein
MKVPTVKEIIGAMRAKGYRVFEGAGRFLRNHLTIIALDNIS